MDSSVRWNDGFPASVIPGPLAEPGIHWCKAAETAECRGALNFDQSCALNNDQGT